MKGKATRKKSQDETRSTERESVVSLCVSGAQTTKSSMIVAVYVSHEENPQHEQLVYAMLDTQSDTSFVSNKVCDTLGIAGTETHLQLSTVALDNEMIKCKRITGLQVRGHKNEKRIKIPKAYTQDMIPVHFCHILSCETAQEWNHLKPIVGEMLPKRACEVAMIIGYNCPLALMPREVIPAPDEGPYAVRTDLGWSVVGAITTDEKEETEAFTSHRILAKEFSTDVKGNKTVTFSVKVSKVKEVINPNDVLRVLESDFTNESTLKRNPCHSMTRSSSK